MRPFVMRVILGLVVLALVVGLSTLLSVAVITRQLSSALATRGGAKPSAAPVDPASLTLVDFYQASGITLDQLRQFLADQAARDHLPMYPAHITFHNEQGTCLVDHPVEIHWASGRDQIPLGQSGVLRIMLRPEVLPDLRFQVPRGFERLKQHTIPLGTAHEPYATWSTEGLGEHVVNDFQIAMEMWRQLARQHAAGQGLSRDQWQTQIQRRRCDWQPPKLAALEPGSSTDVYQSRRETVVIVGHLLPDGQVMHAAGVVVDPQGVIATAYHVIDKPEALARGVLTAQGQAFPIAEILAADRIRDTALVRIAAEALPAAPLSSGDGEGSPLTIVSHPAGEFYSVTTGVVRRYQSTVAFGEEVVQMAVTADFVDGASGGPLFNARGEVSGVVSMRRPGTTSQMAHLASPAQTIRALGAPPP